MARRHQPQGCAFCGKGLDQTQRLIAGPDGVAICAECVALCTEILAERPQPPAKPPCVAPHAKQPAWRRILFHE